jgi:hypothetical protein
MVHRGRERDVGKERFWRDAIFRWQLSSQTIRAFCDNHGLAEGSFHAWRRTIAQRDRQAAGMPVVDGAADLPAFVPLRVIGTPAASSSISPLDADFAMILEGIDLTSVKRQQRYQRPQPANVPPAP